MTVEERTCGWPKLRHDGTVVVCGNKWLGWCVEWARHQAYADRFGMLNMRRDPSEFVSEPPR